MSVTSTGQFVSLLEESNLLSAERLDAARAELATADDFQLPQLVESFAKRGWLTRWQGHMLLSGRHAFFLGRYKLLDHLGEGGMGSVFKAEQTPLGRLVAIKTMRKDLVSSPEIVARFQREIHAAAALNHPNIVAAYDADSVAGRHFLVMEYVEGRDLGAVVKGGKRLAVGEACEYIRQAALGLEHAHERGMVHRDIKPSNLLLDNTGRVKILDMGLARIVQGSGKEQTELTHTGQVVGTPDYMSPEQARDTKSADIRSDIYSLGCTLYRLLTGRVPFQGDGAIAKITARLTDDVPRLCDSLADAPAGLEAVLLKMMERGPDTRYQAPAEVAQALAPFAEAPTVADTQQPATTSLAATQPTITAPMPIAPGLNDFLNQLAANAERDEEADTGTQERDRTQASDRPPVSAGKPPAISRAGRKLQDDIAARNRADKRRLTVVISAVALFVVVVAGLLGWHKVGETHVVINWPQDKLKSAILEVDGRQRPLLKGNHFEYRGRPGRYRLHLVRDGYETIDTKWTLARGESKTIEPDWKPTTQMLLQKEFAALSKRFDDLASTGSISVDDESTVILRNDLVDFHRRSSGRTQAVDAARLMSHLPWPADTLNRDDINPYELKVVGEGDSSNAMTELVAVLGDSRLKHWGPVNTITFSPDGKTLAAGSGDGSIVLWDVNTGHERATLQGHQGYVSSIAFGKHGDTLVSGGEDNMVSVWNVTTGQRLLTFHGHLNVVTSVALSPDGQTIASGGSADTDVKLWDIKTGQLRHLLQGHTAVVLSVAFSPDGKRLASASQDKTVKLWDVASGMEQNTLSGHKDEVRSVAFSADGMTVASGSKDRTVKLWDSGKGSERTTLKGHMHFVNSVAFSKSGTILASGSYDGSVTLWNVETGESRFQLTGHHGSVNCVAVSPDVKTVASGSSHYGIKLWDANTGKERFKNDGHQGPVKSIAVSPDGRLIAAGGLEPTLKLWEIATTQVTRTLDGHGAGVYSVAFSPDGKRLASTTGDYISNIKVWDRTTGKELLSLKGPGHWVYAVRFSPNGKWLATAGSAEEGKADERVKIWDTITGQGMRNLALDSESGTIVTLAFSPDSQRIVTQGGMDTPVVYSVPEGKRLLTMKGGNSIYNVAVSPDGESIVVATGSIFVFNSTTGKRIRVLAGHDGAAIRGVAFHPYSHLIATCAVNGTAKLWDLDQKHQELVKTFQLGPPRAAIEKVAFTPDGRHLISANGNGTIYVLRLKEWSAN